MAKRKPPRQPQQEVQVDLKKADTIKCDDCGNYLFITAHVIKRISPIIYNFLGKVFRVRGWETESRFNDEND